MLLGIDASRASRHIKTGVEWYSYHIIQELKKIIPRETGVVLYTDKPLKGSLANLPVNWSTKVLYWPLKYLWTQGRLSLEMLLNPPDILFIPGSAMPFICPPKTATTVHDVGFKRFPELYKPLANFYLNWSVSFAARKCFKIFVPSEFTKNELVKYCRAEKDKLIVTPLAPAVLPEEKNSEPAERFKSSEFILYIGRMAKKKNIHAIIESFKIFKSENLNSKLKLFLAGPRGDADIETNEDILCLGNLPPSEICALLKNSRALIFPSLYEGFGLPILEAFAAGAPVVTSKSIATEEVAGNAAILVNPENILEIKDAIFKIVSDDNLRQDLIQKGKERLQNFGWPKTAQITWEAMGHYKT